MYMFMTLTFFLYASYNTTENSNTSAQEYNEK